jgi:hypothetical protein
VQSRLREECPHEVVARRGRRRLRNHRFDGIDTHDDIRDAVRWPGGETRTAPDVEGTP